MSQFFVLFFILYFLSWSCTFVSYFDCVCFSAC